VNKVKIVSQIIKNLNTNERLLLASNLEQQNQSSEPDIHVTEFLYVRPKQLQADNIACIKEFCIQQDSTSTEDIMLKGVELNFFVNTKLKNLDHSTIKLIISYFDNQTYMYKDEVLDYLFSNIQRLIDKPALIEYVLRLKKDICRTNENSKECFGLKNEIKSVFTMLNFCDSKKIEFEINSKFEIEKAVTLCDRIVAHLRQSEMWGSGGLVSQVALSDIYNFFDYK